MRPRAVGVLAAAALVGMVGATACGSGGAAEEREAPGGPMVLATTTSTQDSGLLDRLVPAYEEGSDCVVKTVAVGSGEAMTMGRRGDADVLLVHSPEDERRFMAEGQGTSRRPVMHNDFVLVGPPEDPAGAGRADSAVDALRMVAKAGAPFASRGDDSGTHAKELGLWEQAGVEPRGSWYVETGQGMGETLTIAGQKQAYTLSDRGTFLATSNLDSQIAFEGSADLRNDYHVIVVRDDGTNVGCAREFSGWLRTERVQQVIKGFGVAEYGEPLFHPDALR